MKKGSFCATIVFVLLASAFQMLPVKANPDPGLVGLWHFDEGSGTTASDSSGNNYDGVIFGATYTDGKFGKALLFDGADDYVNVPDPGSSNLDLDRVTIEAWIYILTEVPTGFRNIVRKGHGLDRCYGLDMGYPNPKKIRGWVNLGSSGGSGALVVQSGTLLQPDQWYHIVMTYDGSSVKLYLNGVLDSWSTSVTGNIYDNDLSVRIGGQPAGDSQGSMPFKGKIDEVRIYNYALDADAIGKHFQGLYYQVSIDIKPGSDLNPVNPKEQGLLPVAILGSASLDVHTIDPNTIVLGGVTVATRGSVKSPKLAYSYEDVNGDGFVDLIAFFSVPDLVTAGTLLSDTTQLELTATLLNGLGIYGTDSVYIVPPV